MYLFVSQHTVANNQQKLRETHDFLCNHLHTRKATSKFKKFPILRQLRLRQQARRKFLDPSCVRSAWSLFLNFTITAILRLTTLGMTSFRSRTLQKLRKGGNRLRTAYTWNRAENAGNGNARASTTVYSFTRVKTV